MSWIDIAAGLVGLYVLGCVAVMATVLAAAALEALRRFRDQGRKGR